MKKCPHCGKEICDEITDSERLSALYAGVPFSEDKVKIVRPIDASFDFDNLNYETLYGDSYYVEEMDGLAKHVFGRPSDKEELKNWEESWDYIKDSMKGMDYKWEYDYDKGLKIYSTGYSMFFQEPFPDIWFMFWLPDDNHFRKKYFEDCRLVVSEKDGNFWTEHLNENGEWTKSGSYGSCGKETIEKYKKRLEGRVPNDPKDDTFFF